MYGLVNKAIAEMAIKHFGHDTWSLIKEKAGVTEELFLSFEAYPDDVTYNLVAAAAEVLQMSSDSILFAFGEHWVLETAQEAHGPMLRQSGKNLPELLLNMNNLHARISMMMPKLQPPRFECDEVRENSLHLHHHTERPGLAPFVQGLISGLGKMFGTPAQATLIQGKANGADHDIFLVEWQTA